MRIVPHCGACMRPLKSSQHAILDDANGLIHKNCAGGRMIKDQGTVDELIDRHPKWLGDLRKYYPKRNFKLIK